MSLDSPKNVSNIKYVGWTPPHKAGSSPAGWHGISGDSLILNLLFFWPRDFWEVDPINNSQLQCCQLLFFGTQTLDFWCQLSAVCQECFLGYLGFEGFKAWTFGSHFAHRAWFGKTHPWRIAFREILLSIFKLKGWLRKILLGKHKR